MKMQDRRLGRASVLSAVVGATDAAYGLTALHHSAGTLWLAAPAGHPGAAARVVVDASDVTLAVGAPGRLSIRSTLAGTIAAIEIDGAIAAVDIALAGGGSLVALTTRRALDDLALAKGSPVLALVKTVALDEGSMARE